MALSMARAGARSYPWVIVSEPIVRLTNPNFFLENPHAHHQLKKIGAAFFMAAPVSLWKFFVRVLSILATSANGYPNGNGALINKDENQKNNDDQQGKD
jgi:hypothetical protein